MYKPRPRVKWSVNATLMLSNRVVDVQIEAEIGEQHNRSSLFVANRYGLFRGQNRNFHMQRIMGINTGIAPPPPRTLSSFESAANR